MYTYDFLTSISINWFYGKNFRKFTYTTRFATRKHVVRTTENFFHTLPPSFECLISSPSLTISITTRRTNGMLSRGVVWIIAWPRSWTEHFVLYFPLSVKHRKVIRRELTFFFQRCINRPCFTVAQEIWQVSTARFFLTLTCLHTCPSDC